jgi:hypothetical protein
VCVMMEYHLPTQAATPEVAVFSVGGLSPQDNRLAYPESCTSVGRGDAGRRWCVPSVNLYGCASLSTLWVLCR